MLIKDLIKKFLVLRNNKSRFTHIAQLILKNELLIRINRVLKFPSHNREVNQAFRSTTRRNESQSKRQEATNKKRNQSTVPITDATSNSNKIVSAMKPDYFIAHNGLPNILCAARSRRLIRNTKASEYERVSSYQQLPPTENERLTGAKQQADATTCDSEKHNRNLAIKESLRNEKSTKDLINTQIIQSSCWNRRLQSTKWAKADNDECNRSEKR